MIRQGVVRLLFMMILGNGFTARCFAGNGDSKQVRQVRDDKVALRLSPESSPESRAFATPRLSSGSSLESGDDDDEAIDANSEELDANKQQEELPDPKAAIGGMLPNLEQIHSFLAQKDYSEAVTRLYLQQDFIACASLGHTEYMNRMLDSLNGDGSFLYVNGSIDTWLIHAAFVWANVLAKKRSQLLLLAHPSTKACFVGRGVQFSVSDCRQIYAWASQHKEEEFAGHIRSYCQNQGFNL